MLPARRSRTLCWVTLATMGVLQLPTFVDAGVIGTFSPGGEGTRGQITGRKPMGVGVTVTFPDGTTATAPPDNKVIWTVDVPKAMPNGKATITGTDGENDSTTIALLHPPGTTYIASHVVQSGSLASVGGNTFAISGHFSALDTAVDYNPSSPTYGNVSGSIPASLFQLVGTGMPERLT